MDMKNYDNKEVYPYLKRKNLLDAIKQYSDYVEDNMGKSFEEFIRNDYLSDKLLDNVIISCETENAELYSILSEQLTDQIVDINNNNNTSVRAEMSSYELECAVQEIADVIYNFIDNNY